MARFGTASAVLLLQVVMSSTVCWFQELRSSLAAERVEREQAGADLAQERQTHAQALREREDAWAAESHQVTSIPFVRMIFFRRMLFRSSKGCV